MHQLQRFQIDGLCSQVHAMKLQIAFARIPPPDFIQIEWVHSAFVEIVPASRSLIEDALLMYQTRADKDWGMTDCSSFVVMQERGITDALTVDRHFQQAGFRALLLET